MTTAKKLAAKKNPKQNEVKIRLTEGRDVHVLHVICSDYDLQQSTLDPVLGLFHRLALPLPYLLLCK